MSLNIERIAAFSDNYFWLFHQADSQLACVVDPGDAAPVEAALKEHRLTLNGILVTHHHPDHIGGIRELLRNHPVPVYGPGSIEEITHPVADQDHLTIEGTLFEVIAVPGHTLDHIAFFAPEESLIFCGDTLFAGGCGRLFEGTPKQMWQSLQKLIALPPSTRIFCAHEYTQANLRFAQAVEPENKALAIRVNEVETLRRAGMATVPSTLAKEVATNPFLRPDQASVHLAAEAHEGHTIQGSDEVFRVIRQWKDNF